LIDPQGDLYSNYHQHDLSNRQFNIPAYFPFFKKISPYSIEEFDPRLSLGQNKKVNK